MPLERGERDLAWSALDPQPLRAVATQRRLVVGHGGQVTWQRHWHEITSATWDEDDFTLRIKPLQGPDVALRIPDDGDLSLASAVRQRIDASVVTWRAVAVPGGEVQLVVRQRADGSLLIQELPSPGTLLHEPRVRAPVNRARRRLAESLGHPEL